MRLRLLLTDGSERSGSYELSDVMARLAYLRDNPQTGVLGWMLGEDTDA